MKIVTIVGARPQFIKSAPVSKALQAASITEILIHTGQHYDYAMSQIFFEEMKIPKPSFNLEVGSGTHGHQTGKMLIGIEDILLKVKPDCVLVYGDTNSTLAGALAAAKLHIPIAHVEAGLRSFNRKMPEEHNRVLTDHCSDLLFCPTETAVENLRKENMQKNAFLVGDTMFDATQQFSKYAREQSEILKELSLEPQNYFLATVHRPYNTDHSDNLKNILQAFQALPKPVVFPVHPRTRKKIFDIDQKLIESDLDQNLRIIDPVGYIDMLALEENASLILTDSGGIQKEAFFFKVPCITLRPETEWVETVVAGWNTLSEAKCQSILDAVEGFVPPLEWPDLYGDGKASTYIVNLINETL